MVGAIRLMKADEQHPPLTEKSTFKKTSTIMSKLRNINWQIIINAICTIITTLIGATTLTSCVMGNV